MKVKKSIVLKMFILTAVAFMLFIIVELIAQMFFFDTFYVSRKVKDIENKYSQIEQLINDDNIYDYEVLAEIDEVAYESNIGIVISDEYGGIIYPNAIIGNTENFMLVETNFGDLFTVDTFNMEYENGVLDISQGDVIEIFGEIYNDEFIDEAYLDEVYIDENQNYIYPYQLKVSNNVYSSKETDMAVSYPGYGSNEIQSITGKVVYYMPTNINGIYESGDNSYKISWLYSIVDNAMVKKIYGIGIIEDSYTVLDENTGFENLVMEKTAQDSEGKKYYTFIMTPLQSVNEAMSVLKDYYVYMFIIALFFIVIMAYILSKIITKPLIEINSKTELMANMDFDSKCEVNTEDEIGTLSKNINTMSTNLSGALNSLKEANIELQNDIEKEKKREQERKDFIANASHELKTPLSIIKSYSEGILDGIYKENQGAYLEIIKDEVSKMDDLIQSMLQLSKVESNEVSIKIERIDINELIETTIAMFAHDLLSKNIKVIYEPKAYPVSADRRRYEQVITNLMSNGIKYSPDNATINISIDEYESDKIRVNIENTETSIPPDEIEHIWKGFYRIEKSRNREHGGNGLGLRVVKEILEAHNEEYGVENTSKGVKFWFTMTKA